MDQRTPQNSVITTGVEHRRKPTQRVGARGSQSLAVPRAVGPGGSEKGSRSPLLSRMANGVIGRRCRKAWGADRTGQHLDKAEVGRVQSSYFWVRRKNPYAALQVYAQSSGRLFLHDAQRMPWLGMVATEVIPRVGRCRDRTTGNNSRPRGSPSRTPDVHLS